MAAQLPFEIHNLVNMPISQRHKSSIWKPEERTKFAVFVDLFAEEFRTYPKHSNLPWALWRKMAIFLQTKNPNQCRIYYNKLTASFGSLPSITSYITQDIHNYPELRQRYQTTLKNTLLVLSNENSTMHSYQDRPERHISRPQVAKEGLEAEQTKLDGAQEGAPIFSREISLSEVLQQSQIGENSNQKFKNNQKNIKVNSQVQANVYRDRPQNQQFHERFVLQILDCQRSFFNYINSLRSLCKEKENYRTS